MYKSWSLMRLAAAWLLSCSAALAADITLYSNYNVQVGSSRQLTAYVPLSPNTVTYTVNGVAGGNALVGTISAGGLFTPSGLETGEVEVTCKANQTTAKKLGPGQKLQLKLGTGKAGATHWQGVISCQAGGKLWKREANFDTDVRKPLDITFDPNFH